MKGVFVSDPHIGDYPYGRTDTDTGLNTRLLDTLNNLDQTIDYAIEKKVDVFVIAGDIYRVKNPTSKVRKPLAARLKRIIKANISTILMTGNHDMTISSDGAHAMSEMEELADLIDGLKVVSVPSSIVVDNTRLFLLPFVNRGNEGLLTVQQMTEYQNQKILEFNKTDCDEKYKIFFGHFGTDKSVMGNSFDLDMSDDENENKVRLSAFDDGNWTKVYLGHIHKQQEFNKIARHIGSTSRIDFAEEHEEKGFYYFENGKDQFVTIKDRKFKTLKVNLTTEDCKTQLTEFEANVQKLELSDTIVRIKADILQTYMPTIKFDHLESHLRAHTWHFSGIDYNIISDESAINGEKITSTDLPNDALKKYIDQHPERFKGIDDVAYDIGCQILKTAREDQV
ncbi:MAG: metallophosphoesterase [Nitrosarchaeum sp.]|nr:metallophosphoesterase [Nitrosarchaeum sp.]